jgi:hypothetical protein
MPASKQSFGKYQRERDKRAKAQAKQAQRAVQREERARRGPAEPEAPAEDQAALLDEFARLHEEFSAGRLPAEEFEERVTDLRSRLRVE